MRRMRMLLPLLLLLGLPLPGRAQERLKVVCSIPDFASVVTEIGGDRVTASHIAAGNQDPHFVMPKPSFALLLREADLFVNTGLDLEMWAPTLIDKSGNRKIMEGENGYLAVAGVVSLLDVPQGSLDRSAGEIHVYGNPHFQTSPVEMRAVASSIRDALIRLDPNGAAYYRERYDRFITRIDEALFGPELVALVGGDELCTRTRNETLFNYLESTQVEGRPLMDRLGGWMKRAQVFRGTRVIAYHKNWNYFARDFGLEVVDYVEPKPGIPPSARHVKEVIDEIAQYEIRLMIVANYFEKNTPNKIGERTGVKVLFLPISVKGEPGIDDLFKLYDYWITEISRAVAGSGAR
jgi:zinc/manganese transport system substrate-binding protein